MTHVRELLALDRDELNLGQRRAVDAHLAACAECRDLQRDLAQTDRLLRGREPYMPIPRFDALGHRRQGVTPLALAGAGVLAILALLVLVPILATNAERAARPSPTTLTSVPSAAPSAIATAAPATSPPTSAPSASPFVGEPTSVTGVSANALGQLSGNWLFLTQLVPDAHAITGRLEVWGLSPEGTQKLAFSYTVSLGGIPEEPLDFDPYLRRQFSPDGRQVVVSTTTAGLVVVDLPSGQARRVGVAGKFPSWSKDGKTIAYIAQVSRPDPQRVPSERAIWLVPAAGGSPRELLNVGYASTQSEWSADSSLLVAQLKDGVGFVDVKTGRQLPSGPIPFATTVNGAHWRAGSSQATISVVRNDDAQVVLYDHDRQVIGYLAQFQRPLDPSCQCPKGKLPSDPRWNPAGTAEVLFVLTDDQTQRAKVEILDTQSGKATTLSIDALQATWSADGKQVIYIARTPQQPLGGAIRTYDRATGVDRELIAFANGWKHGSVVTVVYFRGRDDPRLVCDVARIRRLSCMLGTGRAGHTGDSGP